MLGYLFEGESILIWKDSRTSVPARAVQRLSRLPRGSGIDPSPD